MKVTISRKKIYYTLLQTSLSIENYYNFTKAHTVVIKRNDKGRASSKLANGVQCSCCRSQLDNILP